nr:hypothetical protein [Tanacetum cinerariifolium]
MGSKSNATSSGININKGNNASVQEKILLVQAQEAGEVLDEEKLAFLADPRVAKSQDSHTTIIHNAAFQTDDLDAFDSDCTMCQGNGTFREVGDEEVVVGESVVVTSSSLEMLTNSSLGGIMVSLIFLEGLEEEALVEFMME